MMTQFAGLQNPGLLQNPLLGGLPQFINPAAAGLAPLPGLFPGFPGIQIPGMAMMPPQIPTENPTPNSTADVEGSAETK